MHFLHSSSNLAENCKTEGQKGFWFLKQLGRAGTARRRRALSGDVCWMPSDDEGSIELPVVQRNVVEKCDSSDSSPEETFELCPPSAMGRSDRN